MNNLMTCLGAVAVSTGVALGDQPAVTDARVEELTDLVNRLQGEIDALKAQDENWLTEQRAEEVRALVRDVLADADLRASLLQSGGTAGHDGKFFLASADGNFRLNIGGQIHVRYVLNIQDDATGNTADTTRSGFEIRRAKVIFSGHVFDPTIKYKIQGAFNRSGGDFQFEDVWISKDYEGLTIKLGNFKGPFMREELVSSSRQLLVDRSLVNERFNQDRSEGIQLSGGNDQFRWFAMYHDGLRSRRTPWQAEDTEYAFAARAELLLSGTWKQFKDFTSWPGSEQGLMIGAAFNYQKDEYGTVTPDEVEDLRFTVDGSLEGDGWNVFAAFVYADFDDDNSATDDPSPWGVVVQGGLFLNEDWELFARYEYGDSDQSGVEDLSIATIGVNRYFHKHGLKWTTDLGYGFDPVQDPWDSSGVGWREDASDDGDGQLVFRSQFQLLF